MQYDIPIYQVQLVRESSVTVERNSILRPIDAYNIAREHYKTLDREMFSVMMLDAKNKVIGINTVSVGSLSASIVHPREVFKPCILSNAASVILLHNHPSGDPTPSQNDLEITRKLHDVGYILGVNIRDHIILGDEVFFSFREKGLI